MTKIDVMIDLLSDSVLKDRVADKSKQRTSGPHKSPIMSLLLQLRSYFLAVSLMDGSIAYFNLMQILLRSLILVANMLRWWLKLAH